MAGETEASAQAKRSMQPELALHILSEATLLHRDDESEVAIRLDLAAGLLAKLLASSQLRYEMPGNSAFSLRGSLEYQANHNAERVPIEKLLNSTEATYLQAARVIVGLTYQAARYTSQTAPFPQI